MVKEVQKALTYEGRLKTNARMLVERERYDRQKRARWHMEVTFPLYTNAQISGRCLHPICFEK